MEWTAVLCHRSIGFDEKHVGGEILEQVRVAAKAMHDGEVAGGLGA